MKPHITVVGAAIVKDGKLLALRRADGNDEVIHKFEFVGGKVEEGETPEQAIIRECREELLLEIEVLGILNTIEYDYPNTSVNLSVYFVRPLSDYKLNVHEEERWFDCSDIDPAEWAPADKAFLGSLKKGHTSTRFAQTQEDFEVINKIATEVMHETYDSITAPGQVDYMLNLNLIPPVIKSNAENGYTYKLIYLNGEAVGFYAFCPAGIYNRNLNGGTYLSKLYLRKFARGKRIASKIFASLSRPVYLTVKRDNISAINVYKHCGFRILQNISTDIGGGYILEDFLMVLNK